ncbi:hypothetical protein VSR01_02430 [Actinacidiphila sp. DG2A-62]|uniref:hypothetical protein n=1 Tax=Actinacidiphila sp. DG2A-62 TaxID=3108821 RepID=UPI002DC03663|nr:hypothetical protein [Actinacidiphila sp. DG2A-62]MEC3992460.1 hypothetical protein [Actinacidiphila sp. DG2A-62]
MAGSRGRWAAAAVLITGAAVIVDAFTGLYGFGGHHAGRPPAHRTAARDVHLTGCTVTGGRAVARLRAVNGGTAGGDYTVRVAFLGAAGRTLGTTTVVLGPLAPADATETDATGPAVAASTTPLCQVTGVAFSAVPSGGTSAGASGGASGASGATGRSGPPPVA